MHLHKSRQTKELSQLGKLPFQQIIDGIFRICNKREGGELNGINYTTFELHNASGMHLAICESSAINCHQIKPYQLVKVRGYQLKGQEQNFVHILNVEPVEECVGIDAILCLPKSLCSEPANLDKLICLRKDIESPALAKFVDQLFADDEIAIPFLQVPASTNYHHNYAGGLLAHCVEVSEIAMQQSYASQDERDIAVVCALFHDIGKVRTLGTNLSSTTIGKMVGHDDLTLEVCAAPLRELDKSWPEASNTMRHVWTCASAGAKYGYERNCTIANVIQFADKLSVDRYYENQAFKTSEKADGLAWDGKKYYWRPTHETKTLERNRLCLLTNTR